MPWYLAKGILPTAVSALTYTIDLYFSTDKISGCCVTLASGGLSVTQASFPVAEAKLKPHQISASTGLLGCAQIAGATISLLLSSVISFDKATKRIRQIG